MTEQQGNPRRSVALAIVLVVVAILAFAAAFYFLDGYALVEEYLGGETVEAADNGAAAQSTPSDPAPAAAAAATLVLPDGMPEDAALRLWQEQVDSQDNVEKLLTGEVEQLTITAVDTAGDESRLSVTAEFTDGTSAPGTVGMRRFGEVWYFAYVTGMRRSQTGGSADTVDSGDGGPPDTPLPSIDEVDVELLNTMLAEQTASSGITERYANGTIDSVRVVGPQEGANSQSVEVEMTGSDGMVPGQVIGLISNEATGEMWFVARFTGAGDTGS
jgi:hypothetical protein